MRTKWKRSIITVAKLAIVMLVLALLASTYVIARISRLHANSPKPVQGVALRRVSSLPNKLDFIRNLQYGEYSSFGQFAMTSSYGNMPLRLNVLQPDNPTNKLMPAVVWIHGGSWKAGSKDDMPQLMVMLAENGYICVSIEYRLSPETIFPGQLEDCKSAIRWLRSKPSPFRIDPNRIGVVGESAGGHLAALIGTSSGVTNRTSKSGWYGYSSDVQAVVDYFGPTDFLKISEGCARNGIPKFVADLIVNSRSSAPSQFLGGPIQSRRGACRAANPITYITKNSAPFLIVHGDQDMTVPLYQSELLYKALRKSGVEAELYVIKGGKHNFSDRTSDAKVLAFLDRHLKH